MKLRAYLTFDEDCDSLIIAAEWQKQIETLVKKLGENYKNVQYDIKVRRDREEATTAKRRVPKHRKSS